MKSIAKHSYANAVYVEGRDVYAVGDKMTADAKMFAMLWRNGTPEEITNGDQWAKARSLFVSGNDVYVVGHENQGGKDVAMLWRNGTRTKLSSSGAEKADALSVYVIDDNVYVVGTEKKGGKDVAMLWKKVKGSDSWISEELTDGKESAEAASVFVVKRNK